MATRKLFSLQSGMSKLEVPCVLLSYDNGILRSLGVSPHLECLDDHRTSRTYDVAPERDDREFDSRDLHTVNPILTCVDSAGLYCHAIPGVSFPLLPSSLGY